LNERTERKLVAQKVATFVCSFLFFSSRKEKNSVTVQCCNDFLTVEKEKSAGSASQDVHPDRDVPFNFYIL